MPSHKAMVAQERQERGIWWDKSWNVVTGCTPAGAGCDHCWANIFTRRFPTHHGFRSVRLGSPFNEPMPFDTIMFHHDRIEQPRLKTKRKVWATCLLGDLFHEQVPDGFIYRVLEMAGECKQHVFVILTKRWERASKTLEAWCKKYKTSLPNAILMGSTWDQDSTDHAISFLSRIWVPGVEDYFRWGLHIEPLLGPIDLSPWLHPFEDEPRPAEFPNECHRDAPPERDVSGEVVTWSVKRKCGYTIDEHPNPHGLAWVVVGGENGAGARKMDMRWARILARDCEGHVPFWFKGSGGRGKGKTDLLDGKAWRETPW